MILRFHKQLFWLIIGMGLVMLTFPAWAVQNEFGYELSTTNCVGETVDLAYYDLFEIYVDVVPIAASDIDCPTSPADVDIPPSAINTVAIGTGTLALNGGSATVELLSGLTYFARARVRTVAGNWSNLSGQVTIVIPAGAPQMPTLFLISTGS